MRIVSGIYKGRNIKAPEGINTRPTSDKTRESIFNIIASYVYDANVLDIFAGSGALAIEAYSRGAKSITLIDNDKQAIEIINDNLESLKINDAKVINDDYKIISKLNDTYDIILLDPPYKMQVFNEILNIIESNNLLSKYGIIVYESNIDNKISVEIEGYSIKTYKYGIAYVNVLKKN